jgi:hypothetical protein
VYLKANPIGSTEYLVFLTKEWGGDYYAPRLDLDYTETSIESASLCEIKAAFK